MKYSCQYSKEYINFSTEFKNSNGSKESIEKLYDLLYKLEEIDRTKNEDLLLSNVYTLLGFYEKAYELYKSWADLSNKKEISKLYTMEKKAKSHKNNFVLKDIRKYRVKNELIKLLINDFIQNQTKSNKFLLKKDIVIFNKIVKTHNIEIFVAEENKSNFIEKVINYIYWLGNCKYELINFYNLNMPQIYGKTANEDWFDTLEIYSLKINIDKDGELSINVSCGDDLFLDHLLCIEIVNQGEIFDMYYDG